jgi:hypothetical protein
MAWRPPAWGGKRLKEDNRARILERKVLLTYATYLSLEELGELGFLVDVRKLRRPRFCRPSENATNR